MDLPTTTSSGRPLGAGDPGSIRVALAGHPFCTGLTTEHVIAMAEGASERMLAAGDLVIRHGWVADALHLLVEGDVALEMSEPGYDPITIETLHGGDPIGWSWLYPPSTWAFDARCLSPVSLLSLDGAHLRRLVDDDPVLGRELALRIGRVVAERLQFARAQLLDIHHHDHR
jgi:CRP/FNR family transcriptional regulator, cyclic AMP receptor protein